MLGVSSLRSCALQALVNGASGAGGTAVPSTCFLRGWENARCDSPVHVLLDIRIINSPQLLYHNFQVSVFGV